MICYALLTTRIDMLLLMFITLKSKEQFLNRILILLLIPLHVSKQTLCNNTMHTSSPGLVETNLSIFFFFFCKKNATKPIILFEPPKLISTSKVTSLTTSVTKTLKKKMVLLNLLLISSRLVFNKIIR